MSAAFPFDEKRLSQVPALQMLVNLGYTYLTPAQALAARGGKPGQVLLEEVLRERLKKNNRIQARGQTWLFSEENVQTAIQRLKASQTTNVFGKRPANRILDLRSLTPEEVAGERYGSSRSADSRESPLVYNKEEVSIFEIGPVDGQSVDPVTTSQIYGDVFSDVEAIASSNSGLPMLISFNGRIWQLQGSLTSGQWVPPDAESCKHRRSLKRRLILAPANPCACRACLSRHRAVSEEGFWCASADSWVPQRRRCPGVRHSWLMLVAAMNPCQFI